jgi:hypothetical protein
MQKGILLVLCCLVAFLFLVSCGSEPLKTIKIGFNIPVTGDISKVGEGSKFSAERENSSFINRYARNHEKPEPNLKFETNLKMQEFEK